MTKILQNFEPITAGGQLLYPLRFGPGLPGVLAFDWWDEGIPKNVRELYRLLQWTTAPFSFLVSNSGPVFARVDALTEGLRILSEAVAETGDVLQRLGLCLRQCVRFECQVSWTERDGRLHRLLSDPPGVADFERAALDLLEAGETVQQTVDENHLLCVPLKKNTEVIGALALTRGPEEEFDSREVELVTSLCRFAQNRLAQARLAH